MAFNSADIAAFKNVWVFCEQRQGVMMPTTFELISEGRKLANELGVELCGILLGDNVDGIAAELGEYGADKVYVYNSPLLKDFTTDAYTKVIVEAVEEIKPEVLLFGGSFRSAIRCPLSCRKEYIPSVGFFSILLIRGLIRNIVPLWRLFPAYREDKNSPELFFRTFKS